MKIYSLLFIAVLASMVTAQVPPPADPPDPPVGIEDRKVEPPVEPRKWIERIAVVTLTEELDLTDDQIAKFLPRFRKLQQLEREFADQRRTRLAELRQLLDSEKASEAKLKAKIEEIEKTQADFQKDQKALRDDMASLLSTAQRARLLVFYDDFEKKLRRIIEEARRRPALRRMEPPDDK
jgi:Spy/CpxP family protein refolding chaperone